VPIEFQGGPLAGRGMAEEEDMMENPNIAALIGGGGGAPMGPGGPEGPMGPGGPPMGPEAPTGPPGGPGEDEGPGDPVSILREMVDLARTYLDVEQDDEDLAAMTKVLSQLQKYLADEQKQAQTAMGISPQQKAMGRMMGRGGV
jgi:hypothetical protein